MYKLNLENTSTFYDVDTASGHVIVEIALLKSGNGELMTKSEEILELSRACIDLEQNHNQSVTGAHHIDSAPLEGYFSMRNMRIIMEREDAGSEVVEAVLNSYWDSGAYFEIPCFANRKTKEAFGFRCKAHPCDDDSFNYAMVEIDGHEVPVKCLDDILDENDADAALDILYQMQQNGYYWKSYSGKTLESAIRECRWVILKDALKKRGHEAVADFVGTDISSNAYDRVLDETEAHMPKEVFEHFWEKYI